MKEKKWEVNDSAFFVNLEYDFKTGVIKSIVIEEDVVSEIDSGVVRFKQSKRTIGEVFTPYQKVFPTKEQAQEYKDKLMNSETWERYF